MHPQQDIADEASGEDEAKSCKHCQHRRDRPVPRRRSSWALYATKCRWANRGDCGHGKSSPSLNEPSEQIATRRVSKRLTNDGIKLAKSRQQSALSDFEKPVCHQRSPFWILVGASVTTDQPAALASDAHAARRNDKPQPNTGASQTPFSTGRRGRSQRAQVPPRPCVRAGRLVEFSSDRFECRRLRWPSTNSRSVRYADVAGLCDVRLPAGAGLAVHARIARSVSALRVANRSL